MNDLNTKVVTLLNTYPTDGTHKYHWVNGFDGVTGDLVYDKVTIAKTDDYYRTYCCGLTFEIYFKVAAAAGVKFASPKALKQIKADWFVATGKRGGPVDALVSRGLGKEIKLLDAQPGDFCQIWRKNGSGHSVIFLGHDQGKLSYWSTQPSTDGIGRRTESFGNVPNPITEIFICRAHA